MNPSDSDVPDEDKPMTYAVELRIRMLDSMLLYYGYVKRDFLSDFFGISVPQASLDIKRYIALAPGNIEYNLSAKRYETTADFKRLFK